jgi:Cytochrome c7 and related cytochrome c/Class III cytochrome C family
VTEGRGRWAAPALGFLIPFAITAAVVALRPYHGPTKPVRQPIAFNHHKHVEEASLTCSTCHQFFETEAFSGLPAADVCAMCHLEPQGKSAEERELVRLLKAGAPLDWKPLFRQPSHVFSSHRRHVVVAKIDCAVCHGDIGKSTEPPSQVRRLVMQDCIDCHRRRGAAAECTTCHR